MTRTTARILSKGLFAPALSLLAAACSSAPTPIDYGQPYELDQHPMGGQGKHPDPPGGLMLGAPNEQRKGPSGQTASISGADVLLLYPENKQVLLAGSAFHPPPGDRALNGILPTALRYSKDGTLLIGVSDGTLTALDPSTKRLWSVGFRGAVTDIAELQDGAFVITTRRGVLAVVEQNGKVRWERQITAEALAAAVTTDPTLLLTASVRGIFAYSKTGEELFTHASPDLHAHCIPGPDRCYAAKAPTTWIENGVLRADGVQTQKNDPHPPVASLTPTYPLTWKKVVDGTIVSVVPGGAKGIHALLAHRQKRTDYDWSSDDRYEVVSLDGDKQKRASIPGVAAKAEVFVEGTPAYKANIFVDAMIQGPNGNPWVLARRMSNEKVEAGDGLLMRFGGAAMVFEIVNGKAVERREMTATFASHWLALPMAAPPAGNPALLCFGEESPTCAVHDGSQVRLAPPPGTVASARRVGDAVWLLTPDGTALRTDAKTFASFELVLGLDSMSLEDVAGVSEKDMWSRAKREYTLYHRDGAQWREVSVPFAGGALFARAADDVWYGGARWDGKGFRLVGGAPSAKAAFAATKDDVWLGDRSGLWHGTAPGPSPVELAKTPPGDTPSAAPAPIAIGAPETAFSTIPTTIKIKGEPPLSGASNVAVSPDGVVWMLAPDRLVQLTSAGKGTTLRFTGREGFGKWAVPEGKGKGILLNRNETRGIDHRDEIWSLSGNTTTTAPLQLDRQDAVAASVGPGGALWILGRPAEFERSSLFREEADRLLEEGVTSFEDFGAHAVVRTETGTYRPVLGLPAASWCDVAAAPDGGAFFAGGVQPGPSGEGILVHAKGSLGKDGVERFRAPASLLAVTATGPNEAWAVGAGGTIAHVVGGALTWYSLPTGEWLRSVLAFAPDDVWIGGDGGTLLHYDGTFHPVHHSLGPNATFTGLASTNTELWAVGPTGILLLKRK